MRCSHNGTPVMLFRSKKSEVHPKPDPWCCNNSPAKAESAQGKLSAEESAEVRQRATKSKLLQASVVDIVSVLMRSPQFRNVTLADLEELVVPAITTGRFMIAEAQANKSGFITPVAVVLWASVSEEIDRQLSETRDQPVRLAPKDWKSGDIPWVIVAAGDQRLVKALQQRLQETVLKGRPLKSRSTDTNDKGVAPASHLH